MKLFLLFDRDQRLLSYYAIYGMTRVLCRCVSGVSPSRLSGVGLHLWLGSNALGRGSSMALPPEASLQEVKVSVGVNWTTVFSVERPKVWTANHTSSSVAWRELCIPSDHNKEGVGVVQVASGLQHALILTNTGTVYSIGCAYVGQTGQSSSTGWTSLRRVAGLEQPVRQVACGLDHSLFLLCDGDVMGCGWAADGQSGTGLYQSSFCPTRVNLGSERAVLIASCSDSSFAVTESGGVFGWGNHEYGQLGVKSHEPQLASPQAVQVEELDGRVTGIAAAGPFTAFLTGQGSVYTAGSGLTGSSRLRKLHCGQANSNDKVIQISAGLNYLVGFTSASAGLLWGKCWFNNYHATPFRVSDGVVALCCSPQGLAALTTSSNTDVLQVD